MKKCVAIFPLCLLAVALSGCGLPPKPGSTRLSPTPVGVIEGVRQPVDEIHQGNLKADIPVFIVSSRTLREDGMIRSVDPFGRERSRDASPHLAIAKVAIGENVTEERIYEETVTETKDKKTRLRLKEVEVSSTIQEFDPWQLDGSEADRFDHPWVETLRRQLDRGNSRRIVVFVHGYNTFLIENTEQAAAIFHYMGREGAVVNFEWPSRGRVAGYIQDKGNAEQSTRLFRALIVNLARATGADSISIIAHSAGNPIVVNALREIRLTDDELTPAQLQEKYRVHRVVMAAPDMDLMAFFNAVFDRFHETAGGVAVYASNRDKALALSGKLFDNTRLGSSIDQLTPWEKEVLRQVQKIEMIDVREAERKYGSGLGHSYHHRNPMVSSDIGLFMFGFSPTERQLVRAPGEIFWQFPPDYRARLASQ